MDLNLLPEEEEYRQQVRAWLAANLPKVMAERRDKRVNSIQWAKNWQHKLYDAGYVALAWPKKLRRPGIGSDAPEYRQR